MTYIFIQHIWHCTGQTCSPWRQWWHLWPSSPYTTYFHRVVFCWMYLYHHPPILLTSTGWYSVEYACTIIPSISWWAGIGFLEVCALYIVCTVEVVAIFTSSYTRYIVCTTTHNWLPILLTFQIQSPVCTFCN